MEYIKKEFNAYNIHIIKTDKFKTVTMELNFLRKIKKEDITIRNFLSEIILQSSKNYKTKRLLSLKSKELYEANITSSCTRIGAYTNTSFALQFLNEEYTEKGMQDKTLDFFFDTIFNPNVLDGEFDKHSFEVTRDVINTEIKSVKDNMTKYSLIKMLEKMDKNSPFSYNGFGYVEDLEKITPKNLYEYYLDMIKSDKVDIFVVGNVDIDKTIEEIIDKVKVKTIKKKFSDIRLEHKKIRSRLRKITEEEKLNQSKLNVGCLLKDFSLDDLNYTLKIYNEILGGGTESKLFLNVREANSLCYYIRSSINVFDNLMFIYAGINKDDFDKTVKLIKKEMDNMKKGKFSTHELEIAKKAMEVSIRTITDSPARIINVYYANELVDGDDINTRLEKLKKVSFDDVVRVANKIKIDTVYLMYGADKNEQ